MQNGEPEEIGPPMLQLFCSELENQSRLLNSGLVSLEQGQEPPPFESLMRAAHSIKGAARVVKLERLVKLAHIMEEYFVALQKGSLAVHSKDIDILLKAVDLVSRLSQGSQGTFAVLLKQEEENIENLTSLISSILKGKEVSFVELKKEKTPIAQPQPQPDRVLRVSATSLNRLMGLAGESLVESRWLSPFRDSLIKQKRGLDEIIQNIDSLREIFEVKTLNEKEIHYLSVTKQKSHECWQHLSDRLSELDLFIAKHSTLSDKLYQEVINSRMRPFSEGVEAFPRLVRDLARQLNKKVRLEILGASTPVDRDILEKLEAPLGHLLRNAVDHGVEMPEQRVALSKPEEGVIRLEAEHRAGMLSITISDDGRGADNEKIRKILIERNLVQPEVARQLKEQELINFLFLPGFSTTAEVSEISGRGVGLNVVQSMLQEVSGSIRIFTQFGKGMSFNLQLPLTLSVIRALLVKIGGEPYAFPLAHIDKALFVGENEIRQVENHRYFNFDGQNIGLIAASQVLEEKPNPSTEPLFPVIIVSDLANKYGIIVEEFLGEKELVVHELDPRLGQVPDISAGAFMEDGSPILIVDVEDMVKSINHLLSGNQLLHNL